MSGSLVVLALPAGALLLGRLRAGAGLFARRHVGAIDRRSRELFEHVADAMLGAARPSSDPDDAGELEGP